MLLLLLPLLLLGSSSPFRGGGRVFLIPPLPLAAILVSARLVDNEDTGQSLALYPLSSNAFKPPFLGSQQSPPAP